MTGWDRYISAYHEAHPGITEDLFATARDAAGRSPYDWLAEAVPTGGTVVDLGCGNAALFGRLGGRRVIGVDRSSGELGRGREAWPDSLLVRADASAVPLAAGIANAVTASMALMVLTPIEGVLAEAARLLRPEGLLVATVPTRRHGDGPALGAVGCGEILAVLGQSGSEYPEPLTATSITEQCAAAGFNLVEDATILFSRPISDHADAQLIVDSFYAPTAGADEIAAAVAALHRPAPAHIVYPIRRLVAYMKT